MYGKKPDSISGLHFTLLSNERRVESLVEQYKGDTEWYKAYGLTLNMLREVIEKYAYYSHNGQSIKENAGKIVADIRNETGVLLNAQNVANAIGTMDMAVIAYARKEPNSVTVRWWRTGQGGTAYAATKIINATADTVARTKAAVVDPLTDALPWYLKPKTVAVGAVTVGLVYLFLPRLVTTAIAGVKQARKK
jgi:hypothetical protein